MKHNKNMSVGNKAAEKEVIGAWRLNFVDEIAERRTSYKEISIAFSA